MQTQPQSDFRLDLAQTDEQILDAKILLLTDSLVFAGTERHILDLSRGLRSAGAKVTIGCPQDAILCRKAEEFGIDTLTVKEKNFALGMIAKLVGMLRCNEVTLIHAHNGVSHLIAVSAIELAGRGRCVSTYHFLDLQRTRRKGMVASLSSTIHAWASRRTAHFIAITQAVATACEQFCQNGNMSVVYNGIFPPNENLRSVAEVRASLCIPATAPLVVSAARLEPEKNLDVLVRAMALVVKEIPQVVCVIAGKGRNQQELQQIIDECKLGNSVRLLGFQDDVASLMCASDLFVLPSACEPLGLVILEAMSVQKAVIAANAFGPAELIENEVSGLLFPPGDYNSLAASIVRLLQDREFMAFLSKNGQDRALQTFNATNMTTKTLAVYAKAMT